MAGEQVAGMLACVEDLWRCMDELISELKTPVDWQQKHGANWVFADVPFHMMYTEKVLVADALERGTNVPEAEQRVQRTMADLNAWNVDQFAQKPAGQTVQESLDQWRAQRDRVRRAMSSMSDEQMGDLTWFPLVGCGWVPAMVPIGFGVAHAWSEFTQLRHLMGKTSPEPSAATVHASLAFLQGLMPAFLDREKAQGVTFTAVMEYTGPGGGAWTFRVADGTCASSEEHAANADVVVTQSPVTFELIRQGKLDPAEAMQSGALKAEGDMATFGELFHPPTLDQEIPAMGPGAVG